VRANRSAGFLIPMRLRRHQRHKNGSRGQNRTACFKVMSLARYRFSTPAIKFSKFLKSSNPVRTVIFRSRTPVRLLSDSTISKIEKRHGAYGCAASLSVPAVVSGQRTVKYESSRPKRVSLFRPACFGNKALSRCRPPRRI
jgi:hypothetical protein